MSEHRLRTEIGALLRKRRQAAAMTQDYLARLSGVTQPVISKVERGLIDTPLDAVDRLFAALGLQVSVGVEVLDAHIDAEIERLLIKPIAHRLREQEFALRKLRFAEIVYEGPIAALLQGVAVPVAAVDIALLASDVELLADFLRRQAARRWSPRWQEFRDPPDPRAPGPHYWRVGLFDLRARFCAQLPDSIGIEYDGCTHRVRPLAAIHSTDALLAALLRRHRGVIIDERGDERG